jgi:hypothetical protein
MKKLLGIVVASLFIFVGFQAMAGNQAQQIVNFQVNPINEISVSGNPGTLIINSATAGQDPDPAEDTSTTYSVTTNEENKKIVGKIDSTMPQYTTLEVQLAAPQGGSSAGYIALGTTDQNLVTGISKLSESGKQISYRFSAQAEAGTLNGSRTVTLTLTDS